MLFCYWCVYISFSTFHNRLHNPQPKHHAARRDLYLFNGKLIDADGGSGGVDIHSSTLGLHKSDNSLERVQNKEMRAELAMVLPLPFPPPLLPSSVPTLFLPPPPI